MVSCPSLPARFSICLYPRGSDHAVRAPHVSAQVSKVQGHLRGRLAVPALAELELRPFLQQVAWAEDLSVSPCPAAPGPCGATGWEALCAVLWVE